MDPFSDASLSDVTRAHLHSVLSKIAVLEADYVLKASETELEAYFVGEALIEPLTLNVDAQFIIGRTGVDLDVSHDFHRAVFPGRRAIVRGTQLQVGIPYQGDNALWRYRPSSYSMSGYPEITTDSDTVILTFTFPDDSADPVALKARVQSDTRRLQEAVQAIANDIAAFNARVPIEVRNAIEAKRIRARETTTSIEALGLPLRRPSAPPAYAIPAKRKPSPRILPPVSTQPYKSEPFLKLDDYEYILGVIKSMGLAIERAPSAFASMDEESLRNHFLLQLNGHYEGTATGETFNASGKTDILIRVDDRNVFIAECKFWKGPASLGAAIDQLLGYLSWRDEKCAIIIFNRTKDSTAVLSKMHECVLAHPAFRKAKGPDPRDDQQYILVSAADPGREILLTTLLFDLPSSK